MRRVGERKQMLTLTDKCSITGIQPETAIGMFIVAQALERVGVPLTEIDVKPLPLNCEITSGTDGKHSAKSLHYVGFAFDVRTRDMDEHTVDEVMVACRSALNREWDIVDEGDHMHFEFQPKVNR